MRNIKQPDRLQAGLNPLADLSPRELALLPQQKTHVLLHSERCQQGWVLEHQTHIGRIGLIEAEIRLRTIEQSQLTSRGQLQTRQQAQHR